MKAKADKGDWERIQADCADLPGTAGIEARRERYAPFFLRMGVGVVIEEGCRFYHPDRIVLDDDARINIGALVYGSGGVWIGRHARIGPRFFVHSANHDVEAGPTAFFERGYEYTPTVIGDNVLISANVSIMPGAELGNGTFVGAGAVVTAGRYEQGAYLIGVPAVTRAPRVACEKIEEAPEIVFLVPGPGNWKDAVRHLLSVLGLPQVSVFADGQRLPPSVHTAIVHGPENWKPASPPGVDVWTIAAQMKKLPAAKASFETSTGDRIGLPNSVETSVVSDGRAGADRSVRALEQTFYWLFTRLAKGADPITLDEASEWVTAFDILDVKHGRSDGLRERIEESIEKRRPAQRAGEERTASTARPGIGKRAELVKAALAGQGDKTVAKKVAHRFSVAKNGSDVVASAVAAALLGMTDIVDRARERFEADDWRVPGVAMPRSTAGGSGFCYSPLVLAWLFLDARRERPAFAVPDGIGLARRLTRSLAWHRAAAKEALVDESTRTISRSLIDNWLALHGAPCPTGTQVVLEDFNYARASEPVERAWHETLLMLQQRKGRPLVRLRPWPAGKKAALSLRYDVDRPVGSRTIDAIVRGQRGRTNAACGSWYFFQGRAASEGQARQLARHWQEIGIHVETPESEPVSGLGVTHHSAATSMYWRGERTNALLDERDADYCEFLAVQTGTPRPAWVADGQGGRLGSCWTTPIHFPLEGSTSDADLGYFDLRLARFRDLLEAGGHCIVATHPDLNQDLMDRLLSREDIENVWFAPVGAVVRRSRQILAYGAVSCAADPDGRVRLVSRETLADVRVELWRAGADEPESHDIQLEAGFPRPVGN